MRLFDLQALSDQVYAQFPAAGRRPVIGITGNYEELTCKLGRGYYDSVIRAGGVPLVIPPSADKEVLMGTLERIDALLLSGGGDINPLWCGEEPLPGLHGINQERDLPELLITRLAYNRQMPILGICRGIQTLVVALGGKVCQDITTTVKHSQDADRSEPTHSVTVKENSTLYNIYKEDNLFVNSFHHQAVSAPGDRFRVTATAPDGIVEAIESTEFKSIIGVQWHPECMGDAGQPLFRWLITEAAAYRQAQQLHDRILTLDTHCDTPMLFPQGIHFDQRDPRILVDLHKMTEGRQDATIMVCYLPQPKDGESFASKVDFDVQTPTAYADLIFDKIEDIVNQYSPHA